jgi:hypothetical protein
LGAIRPVFAGEIGDKWVNFLNEDSAKPNCFEKDFGTLIRLQSKLTVFIYSSLHEIKQPGNFNSLVCSIVKRQEASKFNYGFIPLSIKLSINLSLFSLIDCVSTSQGLNRFILDWIADSGRFGNIVDL